MNVISKTSLRYFIYLLEQSLPSVLVVGPIERVNNNFNVETWSDDMLNELFLFFMIHILM